MHLTLNVPKLVRSNHLEDENGPLEERREEKCKTHLRRLNRSLHLRKSLKVEIKQKEGKRKKAKIVQGVKDKKERERKRRCKDLSIDKN